MGYRVFWDEVPPKTQPLDEANKLVIAPGPFSGSGALCSSRTSITTIYPTIYPMPMIASAHIGGDMAARLKQAGYDFIIIEGKSEKPVYLYINNDEVELREIGENGLRRSLYLSDGDPTILFSTPLCWMLILLCVLGTCSPWLMARWEKHVEARSHH